MPCLFVAWVSILIPYHSQTSRSLHDFRLLELSLLPTKAMVLGIESVPSSVVSPRETVRRKIKKRYPIVPKECKIHCGLRMMRRQHG
jgi:hypothetical protein